MLRNNVPLVKYLVPVASRHAHEPPAPVLRAARCLALGSIDDVVITTVPDPEPGPGQLVVRVAAASVNHPDVLLIEGRYQVRIPPPFIPGSEFAGTVISVGAGVAGGPLVGDRVTGSAITGAFAEQVLVDAANVRVLPAGVELQAAAGFGVAYSTAHHALVTAAHVQAGEWVVVLGAAGGVGLAAVDLGRHHGARVVAVASTEAKRAAAIEAGAEVVLGPMAPRDLKDALKEATGGGTAVVIDPVGGHSSEAALRGMRPGGRFVVVGFASGVIPSFATNLLLVKAITVHGLDLRHVHEADPAAAAAAGVALFADLAAGRLRPRVDRTFALEETVAAMRVVADREVVGKVLVLPGAGR